MDTVSGPIDWSLDQNPPNYTQGALGAYQAGVGMAQQAGVRGALADYAGGDTNGALNGLIRYGAMDHAQALVNLDFARGKLAAIQRVQGAVGAPPAPAAGPPASPAPATSSGPPSDATTPPAGTPPPQARLDRISGELDQLSKLPQEQRLAYAMQIAPDLGFSADQVRGADLSDAGVQRLQGRVSALRQGGQVAPPGGAAAPAAAAPSAGINLHDPQTQASLLPLALYAPEAAGAYEKLGSYTTPKLETAGGSVVNMNDPHNVGRPVVGQGMRSVIDPDTGQWTTVPVDGYNAALSGQETAKTTGSKRAELAYAGPIAQAEAGGRAAGEAPYQFDDVPEVDANGQPTGRTIRVSRETEARSAASGAPVGRSRSPEEQKFAETDADALQKESDRWKGDAMQKLNQGAVSATNAIKLADQYAKGKFTGAIGDLSQTLAGLGVGGSVKDTASGVALLDQALKQQGSQAFSNVKNVRTQREFSYITGAAGQVNDPADKLRMTAAATASALNLQKRYAQFVQDWNDGAARGQLPKSSAQMQAAWQRQHGNDSLFADPVWQGVKIFGKPAVHIDSKPDAQGHVYGYFGLGTPLQQPFTVR